MERTPAVHNATIRMHTDIYKVLPNILQYNIVIHIQVKYTKKYSEEFMFFALRLLSQSKCFVDIPSSLCLHGNGPALPSHAFIKQYVLLINTFCLRDAAHVTFQCRFAGRTSDGSRWLFARAEKKKKKKSCAATCAHRLDRTPGACLQNPSDDFCVCVCVLFASSQSA